MNIIHQFQEISNPQRITFGFIILYTLNITYFASQYFYQFVNQTDQYSFVLNSGIVACHVAILIFSLSQIFDQFIKRRWFNTALNVLFWIVQTALLFAAANTLTITSIPRNLFIYTSIQSLLFVLQSVLARQKKYTQFTLAQFGLMIVILACYQFVVDMSATIQFLQISSSLTMLSHLFLFFAAFYMFMYRDIAR